MNFFKKSNGKLTLKRHGEINSEKINLLKLRVEVLQQKCDLKEKPNGKPKPNGALNRELKENLS